MMEHLNRLRNWWSDFCGAYIRPRNQSNPAFSAAEDIVVEEPGPQEAAVDVPLNESDSLAFDISAELVGGEQIEQIKSGVFQEIQEEESPDVPDVTAPERTFTDPEYVVKSPHPDENIWTPEELGIQQEPLAEQQEPLAESTPQQFANLSHKDSQPQPEVETVPVEPVPLPVAPPVQLEVETVVQPVAPPVALPVQLEVETVVQPVAPPVAPPVQLEVETVDQPVVPSVALPVQLEVETVEQPVAPPVQFVPADLVAQEPILESTAKSQTDLRATETAPKEQANENRSPEKTPVQVAKPVKAETPKKQSKKKSKKISKVEVKVEDPKKPATVDTAQSKSAGSGIRLGREKYAPGAVTDETAQRLARLLISEIKLYNKVDTDKATNNVYDILKGSIDKARKYYEQRLGRAIESMPDYFHAELVRTLCAGDASRLGPNYQGLKRVTSQEELVESR